MSRHTQAIIKKKNLFVQRDAGFDPSFSSDCQPRIIVRTGSLRATSWCSVRFPCFSANSVVAVR